MAGTGLLWNAYQGSQFLDWVTSGVVGQTNVGKALGSFSTGSFYIVAVTVLGQTGDPGALSISGSGWTNLIQAGPSPNYARLSVWVKTTAIGETGLYTVSWPNPGDFGWAAWNYNAQTSQDAWAGNAASASTTSIIAPTCTPSAPPNALLVYFWATAAGSVTIPGTWADNSGSIQQTTTPNFIATADRTLTATGATGDVTATMGVAAKEYTAFQLALKIAHPNVSVFPNFTVLVPPPPIGQGGGAAPTFPPPTPPPIGHIPPGVLIGPAIAYAAVPPSVAGIVQPVFRTGSATSPTAASWFPSFTTTFPSPTFVVSNVWTIPTIAGGVWTTHLPAATITTQNIALGGWGLPGPSGQGPGPPTYPNPPGAGKPQMADPQTDEAPMVEPPAAEPERAEVSTAAGSSGETTIFAHEEEEEVHEHHQRRRRKRHV